MRFPKVFTVCPFYNKAAFYLFVGIVSARMQVSRNERALQCGRENVLKLFDRRDGRFWLGLKQDCCCRRNEPYQIL